jgi:hypothetical protein
MTKQEVGSTTVGAMLSLGVGTVFLQALGAIALGLLGALGGYIFSKLIKPKLDKWLS